jgi:hypothetical protein
VKGRLKERDSKMIKEYEKRHQLEQVGVEFIHNPGDWVIMK